MKAIYLTLLYLPHICFALLFNPFKESWSASQKLDFIWEKIEETKGTNNAALFPFR